jgi:predicted GNAT superfamily acetyltransferase
MPVHKDQPVMFLGEIVIDRATVADVDGILALERANQTRNGGVLSSNLEFEGVAATIREIPNVVARKAGRVVGFLLAYEKSAPAPATVQSMLKAYPGDPDAYVYGPICVDESVRGRGVAGAMFQHLIRLIPDREGILFINEGNEPSLRAHGKLPMRQVGKFTCKGDKYLIFAYKNLHCSDDSQ